MTSPAVLALEGRPFDLGRAHGTVLRERVRDFLHDDLCRLNRILHRPTSLDQLRETIRSHGEIIKRDTPDLFDDIRGLAAGAEIELDQALLLQLRREVVGYSRFPTAGDCTSLCRRQRLAGPVLAQTIDLNGNLDDQITIAQIDNAATRRRLLIVTFTGLLGYLGLNSSGLAVGINLVLGGTWSPGVPPYLIVRHLLDNCDDIQSALRAIEHIQAASSRALMICDRESAVAVELLGGKMAIIRGEHLVHTNHFLHADFAASDAINPFSRNSSIKRFAACCDRLAGMTDDSGPEEIMEIFCQAPIRVEAGDDCRRERTVAAVVMMPGEGTMHVRCGDPAKAATRSFKLSA